MIPVCRNMRDQAASAIIPRASLTMSFKPINSVHDQFRTATFLLPPPGLRLHSGADWIGAFGSASQALASAWRGDAYCWDGLVGWRGRGQGFQGGVGLFVTLVDHNSPAPIYDRVVLN